jgi:hypothetical protein
MNPLTAYGAIAVAAMLVFYALEGRGSPSRNHRRMDSVPMRKKTGISATVSSRLASSLIGKR